MLSRILSTAALTFLFPAGLSHAGVKDQVVYIEVFSGTTVLSQGSGFLVGDSGLIVTNRQVLGKRSPPNIKIRVALKSRDANKVPAELWSCGSKDAPTDACLIKINAGNVSEQDFKNFSTLGCRKIKDDEAVKAMGYGPDPQSTALQIDGKVLGGLGQGFLYPSSLKMLPGMSGGPVYDNRDRIIGILKGPQPAASQNSFFTPISQIGPELEKQTVDCSGGENIRKEALLAYVTGESTLTASTRFLKIQLERLAQNAAVPVPNAKDKYLFLDSFSNIYFSVGMSDADITKQFNTREGRDFLNEMSAERLFLQLARLQEIPGDQNVLQVQQVLIEIEWNGSVAKPLLTKLGGYPANTYADGPGSQLSPSGQSANYYWPSIARVLGLALIKDKYARLFANNKLAIPCPVFDGRDKSVLRWLLSIPQRLETKAGKAWDKHDLKKYEIKRVAQDACEKLYETNTDGMSPLVRYQLFEQKLFQERMLELPFIAIETHLKPIETPLEPIPQDRKYSLRAWIKWPPDKSFNLYDVDKNASELTKLSDVLDSVVLKEARMKYDLIKSKP